MLREIELARDGTATAVELVRGQLAFELVGPVRLDAGPAPVRLRVPVELLQREVRARLRRGLRELGRVGGVRAREEVRVFECLRGRGSVCVRGLAGAGRTHVVSADAPAWLVGEAFGEEVDAVWAGGAEEVA